MYKNAHLSQGSNNRKCLWPPFSGIENRAESWVRFKWKRPTDRPRNIRLVMLQQSNQFQPNFAAQLLCFLPIQFAFPPFQSLHPTLSLFPLLSVFTACKAGGARERKRQKYWSRMWEEDGEEEDKGRENCLILTNTNWCQKLITSLKDKFGLR